MLIILAAACVSGCGQPQPIRKNSSGKEPSRAVDLRNVTAVTESPFQFSANWTLPNSAARGCRESQDECAGRRYESEDFYSVSSFGSGFRLAARPRFVGADAVLFLSGPAGGASAEGYQCLQLDEQLCQLIAFACSSADGAFGFAEIGIKFHESAALSQ